MQKYLGVKLISAEPCSQDQFAGAKNLGDLSKLHGGIDKEGYKVVYKDGYTSWSPKDVFEKAYREVNGMSFGLAIEALKKGHKVARAGWNGKCMHLYLEDMFYLTCPGNLPDRKYDPVIVMYTAQQTHQPGWLASQADILADDWQIIN